MLNRFGFGDISSFRGRVWSGRFGRFDFFNRGRICLGSHFRWFGFVCSLSLPVEQFQTGIWKFVFFVLEIVLIQRFGIGGSRAAFLLQIIAQVHDKQISAGLFRNNRFSASGVFAGLFGFPLFRRRYS